jgi:hypothetical protein
LPGDNREWNNTSDLLIISNRCDSGTLGTRYLGFRTRYSVFGSSVSRYSCDGQVLMANAAHVVVNVVRYAVYPRLQRVRKVEAWDAVVWCEECRRIKVPKAPCGQGWIGGVWRRAQWVRSQAHGGSIWVRLWRLCIEPICTALQRKRRRRHWRAFYKKQWRTNYGRLGVKSILAKIFLI